MTRESRLLFSPLARRCGASAALLFLPWLALAQPQSPPAPAAAAFRADVQLVTVAVAVRDSATGRLVDGLGRDDFEVFEDGAPQTVSFFSPSSGLPLALGLVVDASGSQEDFVKEHRRDLRKFLDAAMQPRDRAFILAFGNRLRLLADFTSSAQVLMDSLDPKKNDRGEAPQIGPREHRSLGTAFYDAIVHAIGERLSDAAQPRKGLIVFSDGEDNSSAHHLLDAIEAAQMAGVPVFAVRYTETGKNGEWTARNKYGRSVMARLAAETGGADFDAARTDLQAAFTAIGGQLHSSYELAYASTNPERDGRFRKLVIRPRRAGLTVRHKTGYWARP